MEESRNGYPPPTLIRDLPAADRPRERLRDFGPGALSVAELLAILLRTGSTKESAIQQAQRLLKDFHGLAGLRQTPFGELRGAHGLGDAKASQIQAAIELGIRAAVSGEASPIIKSPEDTANLLLTEMSLLDQEEVRVIQLDSRNHLLSVVRLYKGSAHTTLVRMSEMFREAVRLNATAVVIVHNHPSGDPTPSAPDADMTRKLVASGKMLDIDVMDHIIFGGGRYVSMRAMRIGFEPNAG